MSSLWFITPADGRLDVSRICFTQRAWACQRLTELGIQASCVVVADDANLDLAQEFGFGVVERDNEWLGRKFNDGYQLAAGEGINYVCPIGSDSWIDPEFIMSGLPDDPRTIIYSRHYAMLRADGLARGQLLVEYEGGACMVIPTRLLRGSGYRPCREDLKRGCDSSVLKSLQPVRPRWVVSEKHPLEVLTMRSHPQISEYQTLMQRWGAGETEEPFEGLRDIYPEDVVDAAERFYGRVDLPA